MSYNKSSMSMNQPTKKELGENNGVDLAKYEFDKIEYGNKFLYLLVVNGKYSELPENIADREHGRDWPVGNLDPLRKRRHHSQRTSRPRPYSQQVLLARGRVSHRDIEETTALRECNRM